MQRRAWTAGGIAAGWLLLAVPLGWQGSSVDVASTPRPSARQGDLDPVPVAHSSAPTAQPAPNGSAAPAARRAAAQGVDRTRPPRGLVVALDGDRTGRGPRSRLDIELLRGAGVLAPRGTPLTTSGVAHTEFAIEKAGRPVFNRRGRLHVGPSQGAPLPAVTGWTSSPRFAEPEWSLDRQAAIDAALQAADVVRARVSPRATQGWLAVQDETVPAWRVEIASHVPLGSFQVTLDARNGGVLQNVDRMHAAESVIGSRGPDDAGYAAAADAADPPTYDAEGTAEIHDPNPIQAPTPTAVTLSSLDESGGLAGAYTRVVDQTSPAAFRPGRDFLFAPGDPRFVQTSIYHNLTSTGQLARDFGFPAFPRPVVAIANLEDASGDPVNNAFYDPFTPAFLFGNGNDVTLANLGTDSDVAAHEMGHHLFEVLVTPEITSSTDPVFAMSEGIADTMAALLNGDPRIGEATVPGQPELRRLDQDWKFPDHIDEDPHVTGLVYGATNWDLIRILGVSRFVRTLWLALPLLAPDAALADYRDAFRSALRTTVPIRKGKKGKRAKKLHNQVANAFAARGFGAVSEDGPIRELKAGEPVSSFLRENPRNPPFHAYQFAIPPGSSEIVIRMTGSGDADLFVAGQDTDVDDPSTFLSSTGTTTNETIRVTRSTRPAATERVLGIGVADFPDRRNSSYTLVVEVTPGPPDLVVDGAELPSTLEEPGELDLFTFQGQAGQRLRLEVEAIPADLDLVSGIFTLDTELLDADDDDGPGLNPLLQGVLIPEDGTYVIAVASLFDDFDPGRQTGPYEIRLTTCTDLAPDLDGDGIADACDDDDDGDEFDDGADDDPAEASVCADTDRDGCDDCGSGAFEPFDDGPDADGDGLCNGGDPDDDNDGCDDGVDAAPFEASLDDDFDFLGAACDNCPRVANPGQEDVDADGLGDRCSACAPVAWTDPPLPGTPDQNPNRTTLQFAWPIWPGQQGIFTSGVFEPASSSVIDPLATGVHLVVELGDGVFFDGNLPAGAPGSSPCGPEDGWSAVSTTDGPGFEYLNRSDALPPSCVPGSARGIDRLQVARVLPPGDPGIRYSFEAAQLTLDSPIDLRSFRFALSFEPQITPGVATAAATAGLCADRQGPLECSSVVRKKKKKKKKKLPGFKRLVRYECVSALP